MEPLIIQQASFIKDVKLKDYDERNVLFQFSKVINCGLD